MAEVLLERDAQLEVLVEAVAEGRRGHGSTALIAGEAGIGKTSLVRALARRVGGEARVLMAACDDIVASRINWAPRRLDSIPRGVSVPFQL